LDKVYSLAPVLQNMYHVKTHKKYWGWEGWNTHTHIWTMPCKRKFWTSG